jgi:serine phosphatase RsbU (regulator of sigma subunit)
VADRTGALIGAVALLVASIAYPLVQSATWQPLAVFAVPPLLSAIYARWTVIVSLGVVSTAAGFAFGVATGIDTPALVARGAIIAVVIGCGAAAAIGRDRRQEALEDARRSTAALSAFEAGLIGRPPAVPGFRIVTRYQPAEPLLRLSGDFVDAMASRHGGLGFVVGDVSGHGASQAALGASLRAGWRAVAASVPDDPVTWLEALREACFTDPATHHYATVCTGHVAADGRARVVSAGHPWPVLLGTAPQIVDMKVGLPLGIDPDAAWEATDFVVEGPLIVYTDGLVEAPDHAGDRWGEEGLVRWLRDARWNDPDELADGLVLAATSDRALTDDIAVIIVAADRCARA